MMASQLKLVTKWEQFGFRSQGTDKTQDFITL